MEDLIVDVPLSHEGPTSKNVHDGSDKEEERYYDPQKDAYPSEDSIDAEDSI